MCKSEQSGSSWLKVTPWGIRKALTWIRNKYGHAPIYITENGVSDKNGSLQDDHRIYYYKHYINNILKAIRLDDVNVRGYTAWSLMDNLEWKEGYSERFGLHYVNFSDPERPRIPKASARFFRDLITDNGFFKPDDRPPYTTISRPRDPNSLPMMEDFYYGTFPKGFAWSSATASYQVEGAWNLDGNLTIKFKFKPFMT
ncbi:LCT [Mytilus edulis]|uniref:beta-glucosidase n=1 Tax=Mytilus edulis TaxID=6550 RepID=A0A8S3RQ70_MYTED|nr:LCT [Mytilus edulis]